MKEGFDFPGGGSEPYIREGGGGGRTYMTGFGNLKKNHTFLYINLSIYSL